MIFKTLARAAAAASAPSVPNGQIFDLLDAKYVQFQISVDILRDMRKMLQLMCQNIKDTDQLEDIVPLTSLIACLCTGWIFNVNTSLRKRLDLILKGKLIKLTSITPVLNTQIVSYTYEFPNHLDQDVEFNLVSFKKKFYDPTYQLKSLNSLLEIVDNALQFYEAKLKQIVMERSSLRKPDASGIVSSVDYNSISEFSKIGDVEFSLDLAVLIEDRAKDTGDESFRNLYFQVLQKTLDTFQTFNNKSLKTYINILDQFSKNHIQLSNLPFWQFSFHRIYALLIRSLKNCTFIAELMMQLYYPNYKFFNNINTKLHSENVIEYENLLKLIEDKTDIEYLETLVQGYCKNNTMLFFQSKTISNMYSNYVLEAKACVEYRMNLLTLWIKNWQFIDANLENDDTQISSINGEEQLIKLLEERKINDVLTYKRPLLAFKKKNTTKNSKSEFKAAILKEPYKKNAITKTGAKTSTSKTKNVNSTSSSSTNSNSTSSSIFNTPLSSRTSSTPQSPSSETFQPPPAPLISGRARSSSLQNARQPSNKQISNTNFAAAAAGVSISVSGDKINQRSNSIQVSSLKNKTEVQKKYLATSNDSPTQIKNPNFENTFRKNKALSNPALLAGVARDLPERLTKLNVGSKTINDIEPSLEKEQNDNIDDNILESNSEPEEILSDGKTDSFEEPIENEFLIKKVRFTGVPPMTRNENPRPTRRGWYIKPAVLHYPLIPSTLISQTGAANKVKNSTQAEGLAFKHGYSFFKD